MSTVGVGSVDEAVELPPHDAPKQKYKSWKKKYNKMRHQFKERMKRSDELFNAEQKAIKIARRLQEQNDQLLDLLLVANDSSRIPPHLRYDLRPETPSESAVPGLEPDVSSRRNIDPNSARAALEEARTELRNGLITVESYRQLEAALGGAVVKSMSLSQLNRTLHTTLESLSEDQLPHDLADDSPAGYLSLEHEEAYLNALDAAVEGRPMPDSHPIRSNEREKEMALRNPMSVYNWLRKHQPQVFLQDSDSSPDKPLPKPAGIAKAPRRSNVAPKHDAEILDEEGFLVSGVQEAPSRSKRKRDDEPYRPKGGSSRPSKKKRTSAGNPGGRDAGEDEGD